MCYKLGKKFSQNPQIFEGLVILENELQNAEFMTSSKFA